VIRAVVFDLDGVLIDSEPTWAEIRRRYVTDRGGRWRDGAEIEMMGMSSTEWAGYLHHQLGVPLVPETISAEVVEAMAASYRRHLPLLPGAMAAVSRVAERWPLGLASSANRPLIDLVLGLSGMDRCFSASVSSEEVARGKPAPDVYLEVIDRLGCPSGAAAAIEDSTNGIRSAKAAGLRVIAVPNRAYPPSADSLVLADSAVANLDELSTKVIDPDR
jgi:HAD superfamily hydrolase (TIGR01509 family)